MSKILLSPMKTVMFNNEQIVVGNTDNGSWMRIPKDCYQILEGAVNAGMSSEDLLDSIHKDDKAYFERMLTNLKEMRIVIDEEEQQRLLHDFKLDSVTLMLTKRCNLNCTHCIISAGTLKEAEYLSTDQIYSIIDKLGECGLKKITLTGGEPLVRNDFKEIVCYIKDKWDMEIDLMTNGIMITKEMADFLVGKIININISMDGANEETCSVIRGKGTFGKVLRAIENLHEAKFKNITLSIVETKANLGVMDEFLNLCKKLEVMPLRRIFEESGRAEVNKELLRKEPDKNAEIISPDITYKELRSMTRGRTCKAGYDTLSIDEKGNISPCQVFLNPELKMGNILEIDDLRKYLKDDYAQSLQYEVLKKYFPENFSDCQSCNVNWFCWICPHELELMSIGKKSLCQYCEARKPYLEKLVWGN